MSTNDIIAAIDRAIGCGHCGGDLGDSPSSDFCSDECQTTWHAQRADVPEHMDEPDDLAVHVFNLVELHSAETCTACTEGRWCRVARRGRVDEVLMHRVRPDTTSFDTAARRALGRLLEASRVNWPGHRVQLDEVFIAPAGTPPPAGEPTAPWIADHVWNSARYDGRTPDAPGRVVQVFGDNRNAPMPLAHFLVGPDGAIHAHGITDARPVGVDPSGDVVVRHDPFLHALHNVLLRQFAARVEESARAIGPVVAEMFRAAGEAVAALAPLADALGQDDTPPTEPRARALWLRQRRNTGPRPSQQRAPRTINPRRTR